MLLRTDVYYEEAWWYSLNLTRGVFPSDGKKYPGDIFWESDQQLPVYGRCKSRLSLSLGMITLAVSLTRRVFATDHDGPVRCEDEATRTGCRGYLEAIYTSTGKPATILHVHLSHLISLSDLI